MPVNVRIVQGLQEAAGILASDRGAQLLGGGTLLVRAINEGTMTEGTLLRTLDPVLLAMNTGGRIPPGAASPGRSGVKSSASSRIFSFGK